MKSSAPVLSRAIAAYRHVVWDWNGTLFDDAHLCVEIMDGLLRARGLPGLTSGRYADLFDFPVREYYLRLGFDFARDPFEIVGAEFMRVYESRRAECSLRAGARDMVDALHASGVDQTVLSAYRHDSLDELLNVFGIRARFTHVVGGDDIYAHGKKAQAVDWIRRVGLEPRDTILIGDTVHDAEVAVAMGVDCVLLVSGHQSRSKLIATGVPVVESLGDLPMAAPGHWTPAGRGKPSGRSH